MLKPINVGAEIFHELIESGSYYVDKTGFIKTVFGDNTSKVMLITRPRRFGKTLTMSTFHDFLSLDPENPGDLSRQQKWFANTKIFEDKEFCTEYMGKFPVVFITLKSVFGKNFTEAYRQLGSVVYKMFCEFDYLADSAKLKTDAINDFKRFKNEVSLCDPENQNAVKNSLERLCYWLSIHHGVKPILLIDEYDVPIDKAAHNNYYLDMVDVISSFLGNALKTNPYLGRAVLTGCLRAAKESIFTGLNNFKICSILDTGKGDISRGIGFTQEETQEVLSYYGLADFYEEVRKNYDGYFFGKASMYCPWDVMSFCDDNYMQKDEPGSLIQPGNYWINTSGNDVIEEFMGFIAPEDVDMMQELLDGAAIEVDVREALCYGDLQRHDINDFWTLLLYTGYLTFDPKYHSSTSNENKLFIPNAEIRSCFEAKILDFFRSNHLMTEHTRELVKSLFAGDADRAQQNLQSLLAKYVSIRDFTSKAPKENYYHGFLNGLLINGAAEIHEQSSNLESGDGYIDLIASSSQNSGIIIILELKQTDSRQSDKMQIARKAIKQIMDRKYADPYIYREDITGVYAWGICFHRKRCSLAVEKLK